MSKIVSAHTFGLLCARNPALVAARRGKGAWPPSTLRRSVSARTGQKFFAMDLRFIPERASSRRSTTHPMGADRLQYAGQGHQRLVCVFLSYEVTVSRLACHR